MIVHKENSMVFLHIPKTGGSSVAQAFKELGASRYGNNHMNIKAAQGEAGPVWLDHSFMTSACVWTVVRNPYARIVSRYFDAQEHHPERFKGKNDKYSNVENFTDFIEVTIDETYLRPQYLWMEREIDYIGRTRSLQQDVNFICDKVKLPQKSIGQRRRSRHGPWISYFNDFPRARELVEDYYKQDFLRFGFPTLDSLYEDRYDG